MSDENPEPWNADHPQKEDWPPKTTPEDFRSFIWTVFLVLGTIVGVGGAILWAFVYYINSRLK